MSEKFNCSVYCQKLTIECAVACLCWVQLLAEKRKRLPFKNCCKTPPTATSLASHVMLIWAVESGCTRSVAFANICFDSENADSAFLFHFKSKFDFGDSLVCPSLAAVSRLSSGVNFAAQCGMKRW